MGTTALLLDDQLTDDERLIRGHGPATFAQEQLLPGIVGRRTRTRPTDRSIFNKMGELGLLGVDPSRKKYGCAGASYVSYGLVGPRGGARR